jgi:hypothetical protein
LDILSVDSKISDRQFAKLYLAALAFVAFGCVMLYLFALTIGYLEKKYQIDAAPLPPLYHNAQQVTQRVIEPTSESNYARGEVSFMTADNPSVVRSFFVESLIRSGWSYGGNSSPQSLYFDYWPNDGPAYHVVVNIQAVDDRLTSVDQLMYATNADWTGTVENTLSDANQ